MEQQFRPVLTIRIFADEKCFGPGIAVLLQKVQELHSLRAAAMSIGMAYSKAWRIVNEAEDQQGCKLIERDGARGSTHRRQKRRRCDADPGGSCIACSIRGILQ